VLVESGSGKLLKRISLGLLPSGLTQVRSTLGHRKPGTYKLLIRACRRARSRCSDPTP